MRLLRLLLTDPRSLRALDETVADRQVELASAATPLARVLCHFSFRTAVVRVLVMSLPREAAQSSMLWLGARVVLFAVPAALVWKLTLGWPFVTSLEGVQPLAWFLAAAWPIGRRVSVFASVAAVFVWTFVQDGWVVPFAAGFDLDLTNAWTVAFLAITASYAAGLAFLGAAVSRLAVGKRWIWRLAVPVVAMVWIRASLWLIGSGEAQSIVQVVAAAGSGVLLVVVITGSALRLFARQASAAPGPTTQAPSL